MSVKQEMQLEGHLDYALKKHGFQPLQEFLQNESTDKYSQKCSRQMSVKLDKLICRELEKKNIKNVSILLTVIYKFGKFMTSNGEDWLTASIKQGLVEKMVDWFEKTKEIFACGDKGKNEALISLAEDLFDVIMIFHDHSNDGKIQILENFIMRICALISDTTFNTFVKQEAVRKLNLMLDTMPRDARKRILFTEEMMPIMSAMGKRIIDAGDYDLQVAITEALCRMTSEKQRGELARQWFPMEFVTEAFKGIKDSDFETDCRKFLNLVNGMLGNQRRVFTYPCLSAFLENYELQIPSDEKLEEFWIDFNTGTQSISFYVSTDNNGEDHQWETVCMTEDDVDKYTIEEIDNKKLLTVALKTPATVGQKEGNEIRIYFDSLLDIFEVASKVFGANKFKGFTKKQTISVAKTAVHIIFDESGSQVFIPESQESISSLKHTAVSDNEHMKRKTQPPKTTSSINECPYQGDSRSNNAKLVTPKMSKVSEASIIIPCTGGLNTKTPAKMTKTSTPRQGRVKPPLEIIHSSERSTVSTSETNNSIGKSAYKKENQQFQTGAKSASKIEKQKKTSENAESLRKADCDDQIEIVPDTQPFGRMDSPMLPGLTEKYLGKHKSDISKKQTSSTCMKEKISISTGYLCNEDNVSDRIAKQRAFYSIFEGEQSPKQARKTVQPLSNETCKITWKEKNKTNESELAKQKKSSSDERENPANIVEKTNFAKSRTALKSPDYNRTNETSKSCAQVESPAKSNKQGSGSRQGAHRRWSERLLEATHPAAASKDTEKEKKAKGLKDAAQALICKIGSKYSRDKKSGEQPSTSNNIDTYTLSKTNKDKSQSRTFNLKNKKDFTATVPDHRNDVYSFKFNGSDNPTIKLGASATSVSKQNPEKSAEKYPNREIDKEKKLQSYNQHKHLFSDTDTDKAADESKTDISWLQNPLSKEKPKVKGYSRQKPRKKQEAALQNKLKEKSNICQHEKMKSSKDTNDRKAAVENPDGDIKQSKSKRPRRAAVKSRNYKDLTDSEPESEDNNAVPSPGTVDTAKSPHAVTKGQKPMPVQRKRKKVEKPNHNQSNRNQPEIEKRVSYNHTELPSHPKSELSHVCTPDSPASIDQIRCEEYVSDTEVKATRRTIRSSSPALSASSSEKPTPENPNGISAKIFYSAAVKKGSNQWTKSTYRSICRTEKESSVHNTNGKEACSPASSPAFQTTLTSISLDHSAISGLCKEISGVEYVKQDVSEQSLNTSTDIGKHAPVSDKRKQTRTVENTMQSCQSTGRRNLSSELLHHDIHKSGPSVRTAVSTLKRIYRGHCDSDVEETHSDVKPRKAKMVPRKLFTSKDERDFTCRVSESMSTVSGNEVSTLETDTWEGSGSDVGVGVICQKISKEFTRKIQNRSRKMDYFTKQSLKSAQQHLTSVSVKVRDCRVKQLDRFQGTILEEIDNFEKDSQALKNMEKEFTSVWKQQTQAFILYQKNEQRRIQHLKSSFEKNLCLSYDYEENIFNAEIHHMKDDMKLVQEKLLKELQEEELLSVRRGLQSLFMAGTRTL